MQYKSVDISCPNREQGPDETLSLPLLLSGPFPCFTDEDTDSKKGTTVLKTPSQT
jgi:hypothetical protein